MELSKVDKKEYLKETKRLREMIEGGFLTLGARLQKIRDERLYEGIHDSFREFLEDVKLTESFASRLITIHQRFVVEFGMKPKELAPIGWSSLYQIAKQIENQDEARELVAMAGQVRREDLEDELRERRTGCVEHVFTEERIVLRRCKICGKLVKEHDNPSHG